MNVHLPSLTLRVRTDLVIPSQPEASAKENSLKVHSSSGQMENLSYGFRGQKISGARLNGTWSRPLITWVISVVALRISKEAAEP